MSSTICEPVKFCRRLASYSAALFGSASELGLAMVGGRWKQVGVGVRQDGLTAGVLRYGKAR